MTYAWELFVRAEEDNLPSLLSILLAKDLLQFQGLKYTNQI